MYLSQRTRADISYAVNTLSKCKSRPEMQYWVSVKCIPRYVMYTENYVLSFENKNETSIVGYCDSVWASDEGDRRSCTSYVFIHQGGAIMWSSRRQPSVALSIMEAEYISLSSCTQEAMWLSQMQEEC